jgi:hypothetical protein
VLTDPERQVWGDRGAAPGAYSPLLEVLVRSKCAGGAAGRDPAKVGYPTPKQVFTRDRTMPIPAYLTCQATCTTVRYKSLTRKHIESLGYRIVANVGDQFSDLQGDHEQRAFKLPNPTYFIP